jgi:hypothetical protein
MRIHIQVHRLESPPLLRIRSGFDRRFAVAKDVKCSRKAQISGGKAAFVADA